MLVLSVLSSYLGLPEKLCNSHVTVDCGILLHRCAQLDLTADDSDEGGFFYNEEEAMNGIGADGRAAMLDHLDSLLDDTDAHDLEEVRDQIGRGHTVECSCTMCTAVLISRCLECHAVCVCVSLCVWNRGGGVSELLRLTVSLHVSNLTSWFALS